MSIKRMPHKPVIAIAGLGCENSTFTPSRTSAAAFHAKTADDVVNQYHFLRPGSSLSNAAVWHGALTGRALPGGRVTAQAYNELMAEMIERLKTIAQSVHLDGLWFDIHGAMYVDGMEDAEFDMLSQIRAVIGPHVVVSASMDLHGNVSPELAHQLDLVTCYRLAPHDDELETKERACRNLVDVLTKRTSSSVDSSEQLLPIKAWIPLPILLPGEQTSTRDEPAKHVYGTVSEVEAMDGVLDAAIYVGYAWGDEPRNRAIVMVTGWDEDIVKRGAERLATLFWAAHTDFKFVAPTGTFDECFDTAHASTGRPYYISDSGDNPTAGGSGDVTWTLKQLLKRPEVADANGLKVIYASIPSPNAVGVCCNAGVGSTVTVTAGAEVDNLHAGPIQMTGRVHAFRSGDRHALTEAVLQVGSVFVILTELRKPYHCENDFRDLDLDARRGADIVIVKIGYLQPELYDMAADWMLALTPGGVDQDLLRLGHHRILRPMWPFDRDFQEPDLTARTIPPSYKH